MVPAGRPTKYSQEMVEKAQAYLDGEYACDGKVIPSLCGLARYLGIAQSTLDAWGKDPEKAQFSGILSDILAEQQSLLLNNGLKGEFNAAITKLVLGKHGYSDKTDNVHKHQLEDLTDGELDARIRSLTGQ